jgi:hypothetical protein
VRALLVLAFALGCAARPAVTSPASAPTADVAPDARATRLVNLMHERLALARLVAPLAR